MKKLGAFLLILLCVLTFTVAAMGDFFYSAFFTEDQGDGGTQSALTLDENGIVYYIESVQGKNHIVKVDDQGSIIVDEELPLLTDASCCVIESMYVTGDKTVYIAGYEADLTHRTAARAIAFALDENGSYLASLMDKAIAQTSLRGPRQSALFAAMSEDNEKVYLAYANEGQIAVLADDKLDAAQVTELGYYEVPGDLSAMLVMPGGSLLAAGADGSLYQSAEGSKMNAIRSDVFTYQMYACNESSFYYRESGQGGIRQVSLTQNTNASVCSTGISDDGLSCGDFSQFAVGTRGKMAGLIHDEAGDGVVYTGTESRLSASPAARRSSFNLNKLIALAVLVGAVLVTVLLWDIYCNVLKMRVSVLVRQSLLILTTLVLLSYVLLNVLLIPQMEQTLYEQYEHQAGTASRALASGLSGLDEETAGQVVHSASVNVLAADSSTIPVYFSLVRQGTLLSSNENGLTQVLYNAVPMNTDISALVKSALVNGEAVVERQDIWGDNMIAVTPLDENTALVAHMDASAVGASLSLLFGRIRVFLVVVFLVLFLALIWVESLTVRSVRRLRKGVDAVSAGNYDVSINVSSGDEVENLAHAFMAMAHRIRGNTNQLTDVSRSYYRFVPENLVQLLGESSIEKVGKNSFVEKRMTVMNLNFVFADQNVLNSTGELFRNINNVIEHLSPVVTENGGTVYDFSANGFIAVFERGDDALKAALRIRQAAETLNQERAAEKMCQADVRIVLSGGDVMLGIVGDEKRMAPAVVSDVIAMTQRIGALQRPSNVYILATEDVVRKARFYRMRGIGKVLDSGRELMLYDVYDGDPFALQKVKESIQPQFEQALASFYAGDMEQARLGFMQIVKTAFDDGVSRNYLYCADALRQTHEKPLYRVM